MTTQTTNDKRTPLHLRILAAMVGATVIGTIVNPGDVALDVPVRARVSVADGEVLLEETADKTGSGSENADVLIRESFADIAAFGRSYPELAEELAGKTSLEVTMTEARVRFIHNLSGVGVTYQRRHNGVPSVSTFAAASAEKLPPFWRWQAEQHPLRFGDVVIMAAKAVGDIFLALLKMVTVPLILTSLVTGVTGLGSHGRFGRMFGRTLGYYMVTSALAIATGLVLVNLVRPGAGAILPGGGRALEATDATLLEIVYGQVMRLIPTNPFGAIAGGEFLSIISFAILTGMFINIVGGEEGRRLRELFDAGFAVMLRMTGWVISLAPFGVAAFMIYATGSQGLEVFRTLAWYMLTVLLALLFHAGVTLPLIVLIFGRRSPLQFLQNMSPALLTAFSTASSNAALPLTMNCVEERAGVSNGTSSFVLPLGATINMDGTALYEVVAVLFIAQATPGIDLTVVQQITVAFTALIASVGAAGIPHAGLVMMAIVLQAVGLPLEAQGVIIAVDRVLDMCRTTVNVWSDSCGCAVVEAAQKRLANS